MTALTPAALAEMEQRAREAAALAEAATVKLADIALAKFDPNWDQDTRDKFSAFIERLINFSKSEPTAVPALAADVAALLAYVRELEAELAQQIAEKMA